jgi:hypothetical protein
VRTVNKKIVQILAYLAFESIAFNLTSIARWALAQPADVSIRKSATKYTRSKSYLVNLRSKV